MRRALVAAAVLLAFPGTASAQLPLPVVTILAPLTSTYGETVSLSSSVLLAGVPVTAGTVDFVDTAPGGAGVVCADRPLNAQGIAGCDVSGLAVGAHTLIARYSVGAVPSAPAAHLVGKAPLTVTADPKTTTYGQPLPTDLTTTVTGTGAGLLTGTPTCAIAGSPVNAGAHDDAITCTAGSLDVASFLLTFVPADLTIAKAPLTLTAADATMTAGQPLTGLTGTLTGFVNGETLDTSGVSGATQCAGPSPLPTEPGVYPGAITCVAGSFAALNYFVKDLVPGALTVLASTLPLPGAGGPGGSTTNNTTNNVTNVGIVGGGGGTTTTAPKAPTLSLLTKKVKRGKKAKLNLRSSGAISGLKLALKRNGKTVAKGSLAALDGDGRVTVKASKKLKKGLYTLHATWAGGGKKRFNVRVK